MDAELQAMMFLIFTPYCRSEIKAPKTKYSVPVTRVSNAAAPVQSAVGMGGVSTNNSAPIQSSQNIKVRTHCSHFDVLFEVDDEICDVSVRRV